MVQRQLARNTRIPARLTPKRRLQAVQNRTMLPEGAWGLHDTDDIGTHRNSGRGSSLPVRSGGGRRRWRAGNVQPRRSLALCSHPFVCSLRRLKPYAASTSGF